MNGVPATTDFSHCELPVVGKRVLRMGIATNYGMKSADAFHAAERGANLWLWTPRYRAATDVIRSAVARDRDDHVVVTLATVYTAGMVRRSAENALRKLGLDHLDLFLLGWLGRGAAFTQGVQDELLKLKQEGKVTAIGTSIHDRPRAGRLATESILDAFMIRYNAKHPGAEQDIFPHLAARKPAVLAYTATSWRQLLKPVAGIEMPPFPGDAGATVPPMTAGLCYRFCLGSPHVHTVWTGPADRAQLDANLDALARGPLSDEEEAWVREYGRQVKARKKIPYL
jgi:aryl-alcohol dehydrogenase-like predicted oxidoreductase